jgi:hypothetical protein
MKYLLVATLLIIAEIISACNTTTGPGSNTNVPPTTENTINGFIDGVWYSAPCTVTHYATTTLISGESNGIYKLTIELSDIQDTGTYQIPRYRDPLSDSIGRENISITCNYVGGGSATKQYVSIGGPRMESCGTMNILQFDTCIKATFHSYLKRCHCPMDSSFVEDSILVYNGGVNVTYQ